MSLLILRGDNTEAQSSGLPEGAGSTSPISGAFAKAKPELLDQSSNEPRSYATGGWGQLMTVLCQVAYHTS